MFSTALSQHMSMDNLLRLKRMLQTRCYAKRRRWIYIVTGVYDIVVKITSDTLDSLKETITRDIRTVDEVKSTMTLLVSNRVLY
jgi:DNA-binding Lrp family transcriptional regulator